MRRIPIPIRGKATSTPRGSLLLTGAALVGARVAKYSRGQGSAETLVHGSVSAFRLGNGGCMYTTTYDNGDRCRMNSREVQNAHNLAMDEDELEITYVSRLRNILVRRLKDEEEYKRLLMYARDVRFEGDVGRPKWEHARIIVCMLHCLMRMHEKILFLLYFAAMKRYPGDVAPTNETLDRMTAKIVSMGNLPVRWTHKLDKDKQGNNKLLPLKMNYDKSKQIFTFKALPGLYELIDIAVPPNPNPDPDLDRQPDENANWRAFIVSYLSCMELLTLSRDYVHEEIDELDVCCKKMYYLLVTTIGGLDAITNYFHVIGSGHVVWMVRLHGNLWRFRGEGVEAFNSIVSLRHNKNNKKGGYKKTRKGDPIRKCPEFWSLGQWLGRWSLWHMGYADDMQHLTDDMWASTTHNGLLSSDAESDEDFNLTDCSSSESDSSADYDGPLNDDEFEDRWNGVWYATPHDYDLDSSDADDISEVAGSEDESSSEMDESSGEGVDALSPDATPNRLSSRDGRRASLYGRACTGLSRVCSRVHLAGGAVHASS